jgi:hypothetical protein
MENNTPHQMKTAEEILAEAYYSDNEYPLQLCITLNPDKVIILTAMETYATQQTADLTTQLQKAEQDKEKMVVLLKIAQQDYFMEGNKHQYKKVTECLTQCGITA